jgi:hypothetical protein
VIGLKDSEDTLENVNMADLDRKNERDKILRRSRQPIYSALDDYEFQEGIAPGTRAPILPQYEKEKKSGPKLLLGDNGTVLLTPLEENALKSIQNKTRPGELQSLVVEKRNISDYYTKKEFSKFSKKSGKGKKRRLRKREEDEEEEDGEDGVNGEEKGEDGGLNEISALSALESSLMEVDGEAGGGEDRGNRINGASLFSKTLQEMVAEETQLRQNFEAARAKAQQQVASGSEPQPQMPPPQGTTKTRKKPVAMRAQQPMKTIDFDEDDTEMVQALARARRLALLTRQREEGEDSSGVSSDRLEEDRGAKLVSQLTQKLHSSSSSSSKAMIVEDDAVLESKVSEATLEGEEDDIDVDGRRKDGTLVFNSTTEFTNRLQARLNEKARSRAEAALLVASRVAASSAGDEEGAGADKEEEGEEKGKMVVDEESDDEDDEEDDEGEKGEGGAPRKSKRKRVVFQEVGRSPLHSLFSLSLHLLPLFDDAHL